MLQAAVFLANSAVGTDTMTTLEDLNAWYETHLKSTHRATQPEELASVVALRPTLYALLCADRDTAAEMINSLLAESGAVPQLVRHHDGDWHLHAIPEGSAPSVRILVDTAMAMLDVVRKNDMSRLGICADDACEGIVLDLSRNRSRRFCSTTCGNRNAVAAYRARHADD